MWADIWLRESERQTNAAGLIRIRDQHNEPVSFDFLKLCGWRAARGKLMDYIVELGFDGKIYSVPRHDFRQRQRAGVRDIDRYRVREMAHAAVLVFKASAVPVSGGLKAERQHRHSHENG
jgi:hypothetical protein